MKTQFRIAKKLFLLLSPFVAGSVVAVAPAEAFTLSLSNGTAALLNFNRSPEFVDTRVDSDTFTSVPTATGTVAAIAEPSAFFGEVPPFASNTAFSQVNGEGLDYAGFADASAEVVGRRFFVPAGTEFSFELIFTLDLIAQVTEPGLETAQASGQIQLNVFDSTRLDRLSLLDGFLLAGAVNSAGEDFLQVSGNPYITITNQSLSNDFEGLEQSATAIVLGTYHRRFDADTYITVTEAKFTAASAQAVPEPSSILAIVLAGSGGLTLKLRRKSSPHPEANEQN